MNKDYYAILGVTSVASQEEIRQAYERLSVEGKLEAGEAYLILSNPEARLHYDRLYNSMRLAKNFDGFDSSKIGSGNLIGAGPNPPFFSDGGLDFNIDIEDLEGVLPENFSEIFQAAIKNIINVTGQLKNISNQDDNLKKGGDIFLDLAVSRQEAEKGGYIPLEYRRYITCSQCEETAKVKAGSCPKCEGLGRVMAHRRVEIKVPKNIQEGEVLKVASEGHAPPSTGSGQAGGDLLVKIIIKEDGTFN